MQENIKKQKNQISNLEKLKKIFPELKTLKLDNSSHTTDNLLYVVESTINLSEKPTNYKLIKIPKDVIIVDVANLFNLDSIETQEDFNIRNSVELILKHHLENKQSNKNTIKSTTENGVHYWFKSPNKTEMKLLKKVIKTQNSKFSWNSLTLPISYHWSENQNLIQEEVVDFLIADNKEEITEKTDKLLKTKIDTKALLKSNSYVFYNKNNFKQEYSFNGVKTIDDLPTLPKMFLPLTGVQLRRKNKLIGYKYYTNTIRKLLTLTSKYHTKEIESKKSTKKEIENIKKELFNTFNIFLNLRFVENDDELNYREIWDFFNSGIFPIFKRNKNINNYIEVTFPEPANEIKFKDFLESKKYLDENSSNESSYYSFKKFDELPENLYHQQNVLKFYTKRDFINYLTIQTIKLEFDEFKKMTKTKPKTKKERKEQEEGTNEITNPEFKRNHNEVKERILSSFSKQVNLKFDFNNLIKIPGTNLNGFQKNPDIDDVFISVFNKSSYLITLRDKTQKFDINVTDLAKYLVDVHLFMYKPNEKKIYRWEKSHYVSDIKDTEGILSTEITDTLTRSILEVWPKYELTKTKLEDLYLKINACADLKILSKKYLVVLNGILNLQTKTILPIEETINYRVFETMKVNYIPNFENLKNSEQYKNYYKNYNEFFDNVLKDPIPREKEKIVDLYYAMSASLLFRGEALKKIFIFIGRSDSGKSTLLKWINHAYPVSKISSFTLDQLDQHKNATGYMVGKWGNIQNDVPPGKLIDGRVLKPITGGDAVTSEVKYEGIDTNVFITTKVIVGCNDFPRFKRDDAMFNRLVVLKIDNVINFKDDAIKRINNTIFDRKTKDPYQVYIDIWFHEMLKRYDVLRTTGLWNWFSNESNYPMSSKKEKLVQLTQSDVVACWLEDEGLTWKDMIGKTATIIFGKYDIEQRQYPWIHSFCKYCDTNNIEQKWINTKTILKNLDGIFQREKKSIISRPSNGKRLVAIKDNLNNVQINNVKDLEKWELKFGEEDNKLFNKKTKEEQKPKEEISIEDFSVNKKNN